MTPVRPMVDVADATVPPTTGRRRIVALLPGERAVAVATMTAGGSQAETELTFTLAEAEAAARAALSGDRRALTRPGLARILCAATTLLFRVAIEAGAIIQEGSDDDGGNAGHSGDRPQAAGTQAAGDGAVQTGRDRPPDL